jgi:hypothetical protein
MKPNKWDDIQAVLQQPTPPDEIKWKCQTLNLKTGQATMVAYTDARLVRKILDEAVGVFGWECTYTRDEKGVLFCALTITSPDGTKVTKEDCGVPSEFEKEKGEVSDAFKRACFVYGICADLYDLDIHYVDCDQKPNGDWWRPAKDWQPEIKVQSADKKLQKIRQEMRDADLHEVPVDVDYSDQLEEPVDQPNGVPTDGAFTDWQLNGRRQPMGFTKDNKDKAWKDIEPSLLIWCITKIDLKLYPDNTEHQIKASKEILTRMTLRQWVQPVHDLDEDQIEGLCKTIIKS